MATELAHESEELLATASQVLQYEVGERLLELLRKGMTDEAATPTVGLLVGLLRAGRGPAEHAVAALRVLASRGTHGDSIREAGAIPLLLQVVQDGAGAEGVEHASGALAHLMMQRSANREALHAAGGVPLLVGLLLAESHAAEYAASSLGALVLCGSPAASEAARSAVLVLPPGVLERFPSLVGVAASAARGQSVPGGALGMVAARTSWVGWLRDWLRRWERSRRRGDDNVPEEFACPITHEVMIEPVVASDGMTYERQAIRQVIDRGNGLSPLTREGLAAELYPNFQLRTRIVAWQESPTDSTRKLTPPSYPLVTWAALGLAFGLLLLLLAQGSCECRSSERSAPW